MTSLTEYAGRTGQVKCFTCQLPLGVLEEVTEGRKSGVSYAVISRWLADEHNVRISKDAVRQHFESRHEL
jgi:intein-encoded DNA endonuclease-like protein